jgi:hypothetical protein
MEDFDAIFEGNCLVMNVLELMWGVACVSSLAVFGGGCHFRFGAGEHEVLRYALV